MLAIFGKSVVFLQVRIRPFSSHHTFRLYALEESKKPGMTLNDYSTRPNLTSTICLIF